MPAPTREDTWLVTCRVDELDLGTFDSFDGGEGDSEEAKYSPGGMEPEISLGGRQTIGNVTIGRYYDRLRDAPVLKPLYGKRGSGRGTIGVTPLAPDGTRGGDPTTWTGTLKTVTHPPVDSTGNDAAKLTLEFTCDGNVA
jgi:hypothetical protein